MNDFEEFLLESYDDSLFFEALQKRPFEIVQKEAEENLKKQINSFKDLVKNNPQKADLYKAKIQLAQTKLLVIAAKKKVELMRDKYKIK
jgi:hypothetical protein